MPELLLFMTEGMSLAKWHKSGVFEREIALYRKLAEHCPITIVSWAEQNEAAHLSGMAGMRVVANEAHMSREQYVEHLIGHLHFDSPDVVVKTNQMKGAHLAARFAHARSFPLIVRAGYSLSDFVRRKRSFNLLWKLYRVARTARYERAAYAAASLAVVSTEDMREQIIRDYALDPSRVRVVPNYVDTAVFAPAEGERNPARILYVGRLEAQKNLPALVRACTALPWAELVIVGEGSQRAQLEALARPAGERIRFLGQRPNTELPALLASASIFVLPSLYEGHPKTLIEAMCTGIAVLGANAPGIAGMVRDGESGLLCEHSQESIAAALQKLHDDPALRMRLGRDGMQQAVTAYSLEGIVQSEIDNLKTVQTLKTELPLAVGSLKGG